MNAITLRNNFHNSSATVRPSAEGLVSVRAYRRAMGQLCGMTGCRCGGVRGPQEARLEAEYNAAGIGGYRVQK